MKFVLLFGPQAVGKMTVGQELEKLTGLKLFHNHMTIDLVAPFFNYGTAEGKRLVALFRREIFEAVAQSDLPGLIFTFVWAFNEQADWDYVRDISDIFRRRGADIYFVELQTDVEERLRRNTTPNRLACKPTKRDTVFTERDILRSVEKYRLASLPGEITETNYLRIDNTDMEPREAALRIAKAFRWQ